MTRWPGTVAVRWRQHLRRRHHDHGSVTAETAVALPALILVVAALVWLIGVLGAHVRCADAAREAVRAAARGDDAGAVRAVAAEVAPAGSVVDVSSGDTVRAVVTARVNAPGLLASLLPAMTVSGSAVALPEAGILRAMAPDQ